MSDTKVFIDGEECTTFTEQDGKITVHYPDEIKAQFKADKSKKVKVVILYEIDLADIDGDADK